MSIYIASYICRYINMWLGKWKWTKCMDGIEHVFRVSEWVSTMVSYPSQAETKALELSAKSKGKSVVSYAIIILSNDSLYTKLYFCTQSAHRVFCLANYSTSTTTAPACRHSPYIPTPKYAYMYVVTYLLLNTNNGFHWCLAETC